MDTVLETNTGPDKENSLLSAEHPASSRWGCACCPPHSPASSSLHTWASPLPSAKDWVLFSASTYLPNLQAPGHCPPSPGHREPSNFSESLQLPLLLPLSTSYPIWKLSKPWLCWAFPGICLNQLHVETGSSEAGMRAGHPSLPYSAQCGPPLSWLTVLLIYWEVLCRNICKGIDLSVYSRTLISAAGRLVGFTRWTTARELTVG